MTTEGVDAVRSVHRDLSTIIHSLRDEEWELPSACAGWRTKDLVAHFTSNFKEMVDPTPLPDPQPDMSGVKAEEAMEALVAPRKDWSPAELLDEYDRFAEPAFAALAAMQEEPVASTVIPLADLGSYPTHLLADAYAFDHYCHLYVDLLAPGGSIERATEPPTDEVLRPGIGWMLAGIPQMCRDALAGVTQPVTLELTGPGGGTWTVHPPGDDGLVSVTEGGGGDATVTSTTHDFVSWGTKRSAWRDACTVHGDDAAAAALLDNLDVI